MDTQKTVTAPQKIASILADMPGEPRVPIYWDGKMLYAILPDGSREEIGECIHYADVDALMAGYHWPCWGLQWAE